MPIEFITHHLNIRLDVLYVVDGQLLPPRIPDHDVAICAVSDSKMDTLIRLGGLLRHWPRPVVNNPALIGRQDFGRLTRDGIASLFAQSKTIWAPATVLHGRDELQSLAAWSRSAEDFVPDGFWPLLIRPVGSHAGRSLEMLAGSISISRYFERSAAESFYVSQFVDYRNVDGLYRKRRVALVDGQPLLCHMGVSGDWMIHYLNAGMCESLSKRDDEALAMADFDEGFGRRHRAAFAELHEALGLDYVLLDCAEAPDGRLLVFEVEMAAIIHLLDPVEMFPYKQPQMRRIFAAFESLLQHRSALVAA
jgi:hypothetical protein